MKLSIERFICHVFGHKKLVCDYEIPEDSRGWSCPRCRMTFISWYNKDVQYYGPDYSGYKDWGRSVPMGYPIRRCKDE